MSSSPARTKLEYPLAPHYPSYWLGERLTALAASLFADWQVEGEARMPKSGPIIVAANHFSLVDPPLLAASIPRQMSYLGKAELWGNLIGRIFSRGIGIIPLRRGQADRPALRTALTVLEHGGVVGVFPEGTRGRDHPRRLKPGLPGIALLARLSGAPLLPVGIAGTDAIDRPSDLLTKAFTRPRFRVVIGDPFDLPVRQPRDLEADTALIMTAIANLLPERYWGLYTGDAVGR
ncbi:MAG: 1-acyl-sn-glycerol-3-phosphate acyltransferase [Dehalococcoidia bacterium]|nr:1-acyl-sn-glycerol-3-phosphate acyltransferase [Dehalococcoidia bacterium]